MSFVTGLLLIDAPAAALNNLGSIPGERTDNTSGVKMIYANGNAYPYVSAQAFRYWLRTTLEMQVRGWVAAPIYREEKIAYTDSNPIRYWDDDVFGYMRAPATSKSAQARRDADVSRATETRTTETVTRAAPFRVGTLVSLTSMKPTQDFGTMSRHDGDPVPHEHQFYHATLKGLFSLNLHACGTFSYRKKTGFRNLDDGRVTEAQNVSGIEHLEAEKSYRLPIANRIQRVRALFEGMARLEGGAKQTLHYTDVSPALVLLAVTKGGNHIFNHVVGVDSKGMPKIKRDALQEALTVYSDELLSPIYVGWVRGYLDAERAEFDSFAQSYNAQAPQPIIVRHPREIFIELARAFEQHPEWLV